MCKKKQKIADRIAVKPFLTPLFFCIWIFPGFQSVPEWSSQSQSKSGFKKGGKRGEVNKLKMCIIQRINVNTLMRRSFVVKVSGSTKFNEKSREGLLDCISV